VKIGFENLVSPELLQTVFANPDEFREKIKKEFERVMPQCLQNMGFGRKKITGNHIEKTCDNLHIEIDGIRMRIADAKNPTVVNEQAENSRPNNPLIRQRRQEAPKSSEMDEKLTAAVAAYKKRNNEE